METARGREVQPFMRGCTSLPVAVVLGSMHACFDTQSRLVNLSHIATPSDSASALDHLAAYQV